MKMTLTKLLIPAMLNLGAPITQPAYAQTEVGVRFIPERVTFDECGPSFFGRCEDGIWCDGDEIPVTVPYGEAAFTFDECADGTHGHFGEVFSWGRSGYGVAQDFEPIGPGGPIDVWGEVEWDGVVYIHLEPVDLFDFLNLWFHGMAVGNADGDFNNDGATTVQDIFDFLAAM